jgi:tripartite-type tricarboxylate transporter receptor subunit TctC
MNDRRLATMPHRNRFARLTLAIVAAAFLAIPTGEGRADTVGDFYKGKTVRIHVGASAGGEYDLLARLIGKHIGRFIPGNPNVIIVNMPGAIGVTMSNHLYARAEKDGTALGLVNNNQPIMEVLGVASIRFKLAQFRWIGAIAPVENMIIVRSARGVKTVDEARKTELVVGSMGRGNLTYAFPALMNDLVGTRFKIVTGYVSGPEMNLALERGEVDARSSSWSSLVSTNADWIRDKKIQILVQAGPRSKEKDLASLPSIEDLAKNADDKAVVDLIFAGSRMGRPLAAPPEIPADRLAALRNAFAAVMKDPAFLKDAAAASVTVDPVSSGELEAVIARVQSIPKHVVQRAKKYLER